jgi:ATP/maltotriose-dependent transcriptional regulator MalT
VPTVRGESRTNGTVPDRRPEALPQRTWDDAYAKLSSADREAPLEPEDLERLATSAFLLGRDSDGADAWSRAHNEYLRRGDVARAVCCAFWLGFGLMYRGSMAQGSGWMSRARRLVDDTRLDCAGQGYLLVPVALQRLSEGDYVAAHSAFSEAATIGDRFREPDLMTLGRLGQGQALIGQDRIVEGVALLDEVMVAVTVGEVSPLAAGIVYCAVIEACQEIFDLRRAQEWTAALSRWCESQVGLVPYRGQCLVRRAELLRLHGAWQDAMDEAERARERLSDPPNQAAIGLAFYQQAELYRLRGELVKAEEAYREASRWGRRARPGMALLRLAQGQLDSAQATIRRLLDETGEQRARPELLAAFVEIMLASNDVPSARVAADELSKIAAVIDAPFLHALSAHSSGAVLLGEGDAHAAHASLQSAWTSWQQLQAPYEAARTRVLIGLACRALGDEDAARMELDAAREAFQQLGATPEVARVERLSGQSAPRSVGRLTAREIQVLRLVATGKTNRAIAAELLISEKTVARHLCNLFVKLGLENRAAATAYAYQHELV